MLLCSLKIKYEKNKYVNGQLDIVNKIYSQDNIWQELFI